MLIICKSALQIHSSLAKTKIKLKKCLEILSNRAHPQDIAFLSGDLIYVASSLFSTNILVEMELVILLKNNA